MSEFKYFTFPVSFLPELLEDICLGCNNIIDYSICAHSRKLNEGNEADKVLASAKFHGVSVGSVKRTLERGKILFEDTPANFPITSVNVDTVFDFRNNYKSDFDIDCMVAFAALKSIIGHRAYTKINDSALLSRMSGLSGLTIHSEEIPERLEKYTKRYHREKLFYELNENWGITTYSRFTRGYFISTSLDYESLGFNVEKSRLATKQNQAKKEANARIMARLYPP